jgi:glycine/D-amino acid oxidase-like deaminating enzyme
MSRIIPDPIGTTFTPLPAQCDVVVIGGGIAGVCTALSLAERGLRVTVCEKGLIGAEQSSRNWGWIRQMGRDPAEIPLSIESLRLWRAMPTRYGIETGFRQTGITYLCRDAAELAEYEAWLPHAKHYGIDTRMLHPAELPRYLPGIAEPFAGGMYTPSDGRGEPLIAAPAIARAAQTLGVHIATRCAVRGIETHAGRVSAVVTEQGVIRCNAAVLAGGAWSRLFAGSLGIDLPQLRVLGSVARIMPSRDNAHAAQSGRDGITDMPVGGDHFAFRRRLDGGFTVAMRNATIVPIVPDSFRLFSDFRSRWRENRRELRLRLNRRFIEEWRLPHRWALDAVSPFEHVRIMDPVPSDALIRDGLQWLARAFPAFAGARVLQTWGGLIDVTPDAVPVIGAVDALPGFFMATGLSGHGFGLGPGTGLLMAQLVNNETPVVDPAPFRFNRFRPLSRAPLSSDIPAAA